MTVTSPGSGALELRGVSKRYGTGAGGQVTAASNVTFTIEAGAFVALTGASGSGKSTLLHMIGAIERPDSGTIISNGTDVTALHGAAQADYRRTDPAVRGASRPLDPPPAPVPGSPREDDPDGGLLPR
jgi:ABC-type glutathione transport system ATPase component